MSKLVLSLAFSLVITIVRCQNVDKIIFTSANSLEVDDPCSLVLDDDEVFGKCMSIQQCYSTFGNIQNLVPNPVVCGYENTTQIICCPLAELEIPEELEYINDDLTEPTNPEKLTDLKIDLKCAVANSNGTGIIKFLSDCPELSDKDPKQHINKLCTDEICSDLVCCPVKLKNRLKNMCYNVDQPTTTLDLRLSLNLACTVNGLNITGRYQTRNSCGYAKRHPHLLPQLEKVCSYHNCRNWLCCPIEDNDIIECTSGQISRSVATLVGPQCVDSRTKIKGRCRSKTNCQHDVKTLDTCGSYCCQEYVCCPDHLSQTKLSISSRECNSYSKYVSKEEVEVPLTPFNNRTFCYAYSPAGGADVFPGEFPHMAALGYKPSEEILWNCGGSLISNQYVLTAAHCLTDNSYGPVQKVRLGAINLQTEAETSDCPEDFDVIKLIPHPEYNRKFVYNDIGLVMLASKATYNFHIRPICLPPSADVAEYFISTGWGATGPVDSATVKLLQVGQEIFSYEECQIQYGVRRRFPSGIKNDTQICAGSRKSIESTCGGDSGGPLVVKHPVDEYLFYIQGIVSFGVSCGFANSAGVYTKVYPYVKWIEDTVWKA